MSYVSDEFRSLFPGVIHPILQAPMAGTATPELAAAVSNAGAIGSIGLGSSTAEQSSKLIEETHALTDKPFNVNVFCHQPAMRDPEVEKTWLHHLQPLFDEVGLTPPDHLDELYKSFIVDDEVLDILLETRPAIVSFHFGLPQPHQLKAIHDAGITTLATATNLTDARLIEASGIHGIVAQGIEAGGHRGMFSFDVEDQKLPTSVLVRQLVQEINLPIIAAGGIMDGTGIRAALIAGAAAAQLGTAFILCPESAANDAYRSALRSESSAATRSTAVLSGRPARGLRNRLVEHGEAPGSPVPADYPLTYDATKQLIAAASERGISGYGAHWAGQGAPLVREMSASELVATLVRELEGQ